MSLLNMRLMLVAALFIFASTQVSAIVPLPGYGGKSLAMAGVGVATPLDTFVMVSNPAGISFLEDRYDAGISYGKPSDHIKVRGNLLIPHSNFKSSPDILAPGYGIKKDWKCVALGLVFYGRGAGVNYGRKVPLFGKTKMSFEYDQYIIKPVVAWKLNQNQSIALGVDCVMGMFRQTGAQNFKPGSISPHNVTNKGFDYRFGMGYHVGWVGRFFDRLKLGVSYESQLYTHRFEKYRGLIAQRGKANGPAILGLGACFDASCRLSLSLDFQKLFWKNVKGISNRQSFVALNGSSNGSAFGWKNQNMYRCGVAYKYNEQLTLRAGYAHTKSYIPSSQIFLNLDTALVFPTSAVTAGFTWEWKCHEFNVAYAQAFKRHFNGDIAFLSGGGNIKSKTPAYMIGLFYGHKL